MTKRKHVRRRQRLRWAGQMLALQARGSSVVILSRRQRMRRWLRLELRDGGVTATLAHWRRREARRRRG